MELLTKTTIKLIYTGHLQVSKLAVWVPSWGTEPNSAQQLRYVGIHIENIIWIDLRVMVTT